MIAETSSNSYTDCPSDCLSYWFLQWLHEWLQRRAATVTLTVLLTVYLTDSFNGYMNDCRDEQQQLHWLSDWFLHWLHEWLQRRAATVTLTVLLTVYLTDSFNGYTTDFSINKWIKFSVTFSLCSSPGPTDLTYSFDWATYLSNIDGLNSKLVCSALLKLVKWWTHRSQHNLACFSFLSKQLNIKIGVRTENITKFDRHCVGGVWNHKRNYAIQEQFTVTKYGLFLSFVTHKSDSHLAFHKKPKVLKLKQIKAGWLENPGYIESTMHRQHFQWAMPVRVIWLLTARM